MARDGNEVVGTIKTIVKKFDGDFEEGKEPVEIIEREEPLLLKDARAFGLIKGEDNAAD